MTAVQQQNWLVPAMSAMLCFVAVALIIKRLTLVEPRTEIINFYFALFITIVFLIFSYLKGTRLTISTASIKWFVLLSIVAAFANYFSVAAIRAAPNPGYVTGVRAFETPVIAIIAIFVFQSEITGSKLLGIVLSLCGLILLSR